MTFHELYKSLVVTHKLVTHEYFMDEMQIPDIVIATKYLNFAEVISWDQTRHMMLCSLKPYLKKKNTTADELFQLPIDEGWQEKEQLTTEISNEDVAWFNEYVKRTKESQ